MVMPRLDCGVQCQRMLGLPLLPRLSPALALLPRNIAPLCPILAALHDTQYTPSPGPLDPTPQLLANNMASSFTMNRRAISASRKSGTAPSSLLHAQAKRIAATGESSDHFIPKLPRQAEGSVITLTVPPLEVAGETAQE